MYAFAVVRVLEVNRHTGGLENNGLVHLINGMVNRHTGGLEITGI